MAYLRRINARPAVRKVMAARGRPLGGAGGGAGLSRERRRRRMEAPDAQPGGSGVPALRTATSEAGAAGA